MAGIQHTLTESEEEAVLRHRTPVAKGVALHTILQEAAARSRAPPEPSRRGLAPSLPQEGNRTTDAAVTAEGEVAVAVAEADTIPVAGSPASAVAAAAVAAVVHSSTADSVVVSSASVCLADHTRPRVPPVGAGSDAAAAAIEIGSDQIALDEANDCDCGCVGRA